MNTHDYLMAAAGGVLIGFSAVLLLWLNGRIAGISGILNGVLTPDQSGRGWRLAFVVGLVLGGAAWQGMSGIPVIDRTDFPLAITVLAGVLVGYGTRLGSGCTSGHGICGVARLSPRSIVATLTFVLVGMLTATSISKVLS